MSVFDIFTNSIVKDIEDIAQVQLLLDEHNECVIMHKVDKIVDVLTYMKKNLGFEVLIDIYASHLPNREQPFDLIYNLLNMQQNARMRIKILVNDAVPTACEVFSCANWMEREVWDMFGINFTDHPNLCRILTDYGFVGFPLRKDFPLTGNYQIRYDEAKQSIIREPVKLQEAFRDFDTSSKWKGEL